MFSTSKAVAVARPIAVVASVMFFVTACGGEASARDAAVDRAVEEGLGREVAECIVNGVADAFGEEALAEDFEASSEQMSESFEITDTCLFGE